MFLTNVLDYSYGLRDGQGSILQHRQIVASALLLVLVHLLSKKFMWALRYLIYVWCTYVLQQVPKGLSNSSNLPVNQYHWVAIFAFSFVFHQ